MNKTQPSSQKVTLLQWEYFVSAVEKGSFLRAAEEFNTDAAQVSREIQKLEHALSESLFERSHSGVRPTWVGRQKYAEAKRLIEDFRSLIKKSSPVHQHSSVIRIAVPASLADLIMKPLADFEKGNREFPLRLELENYDVVSGINPENFDLIFCVETLPNVRFIAYEVAEIAYGIFASAKFLKRGQVPFQPEDLEKLPLIHQEKATILLQGSDESVGIHIEPLIKVNSVSSMLASAMEGLGIAVGVPLWAIGNLEAHHKLIRLLPEWKMPASKVWLLKHPGKSSLILDKLVPFLKDVWLTQPKNTAGTKPKITEAFSDHP